MGNKIVCLYCLFSRHHAQALEKAEEWREIVSIASTYEGRARRLEIELAAVACICGVSNAVD